MWVLIVESTNKRGKETMMPLTNGDGRMRVFLDFNEIKMERREHPLSVVVPIEDWEGFDGRKAVQ